jgi:signal transduction histidine kinase
MIGQVIQNLASNGAKYNKPGGNLFIKAYKDNKNIIIELEDTGIGIAKKDLKKIFKIFTRIKNQNSKTIGYGIGLAFAKECVEAHNGIIAVKSKLGAGTVFKVVLPMMQHLQD